ncbi:hypothetical protein NC653_001977 [Populus alba x Populus x berolinensis]|uniref:Uncharacterized protein n=1 Tax=Populus alba x Populus x berolinensis TaxID=444605 RepID=A0AAD6RMH1_9ROSI|nr:hypothetical protein NC653_001977 [Populus alba x Populus x berolinensis]
MKDLSSRRYNRSQLQTAMKADLVVAESAVCASWIVCMESSSKRPRPQNCHFFFCLQNFYLVHELIGQYHDTICGHAFQTKLINALPVFLLKEINLLGGLWKMNKNNLISGRLSFIE